MAAIDAWEYAFGSLRRGASDVGETRIVQDSVRLLVVIAATLVAAATDVWSFRIYNILTLPLFLSGLLYGGMTGGGPGVVLACLGIVMGLCLISVPSLCGRMGAGDVKLTVGVGAWLGPWLTLHVLLFAWIAAGLYSAILAATRIARGTSSRPVADQNWIAATTGRPLEVGISWVVRQEDSRRRLVPFGAMLALGVCGAIVWTTWTN